MFRPFVVALLSLLTSASLATAQGELVLPKGAVARLGVHRLRVAGQIFTNAFTPDGRTLVVAHTTPSSPSQSGKEVPDPPNIVLFDTTTGRVRKRLNLRGHIVTMAKEKPVMALAGGKGIEIWDIEKEKPLVSCKLPENVYGIGLMVIAADASLVAAICTERDKSVVVRWELPSGKLLPVIRPVTNQILSLSISDDSKKIFAASTPILIPGKEKDIEKNNKVVPGHLFGWEARSGKPILELSNHHHFVIFSPDGTKIAAMGQNDQSVSLMNLDSPAKEITSVPGAYVRFEFTPDSKSLVIFSNRQPIRVWDIAAKKEVRSFGGGMWDFGGRASFSQDGRWLTAVQTDVGSQITFFDVTTGAQKRIESGHPNTVNGLAYSPDGKHLASISMDTILIYDPHTGNELRRWVAHTASIEQIVYSPDGKLLASASVDGTVALWDPATGKERQRRTAKGSVHSIAFSRDGATLYAASDDKTVEVWNLEDAAVQRAFDLGTKSGAVALSPGGRFVAYFPGERQYRQFSSTLHWMDARTGKSLPSIKLRERAPVDEGRALFEGVAAFGFVFSPDGKVLATSDSLETHSIRMVLSDHTVRIWETGTRREIMKLTALPIAPRLLAISPDNRILAHGIGGYGRFGWGTDQAIILRDISVARSQTLADPVEKGNGPSYEMMKRNFPQIGGHLGSITCMTFSPDSQFLATGGSDQIIYIWRVKDFYTRSDLPESKENVANLWDRLGDSNGGEAYQAIAQLERRPKEALVHARRHLRPTPTADEKVMQQHLRDLASSNFAVRQQAYSALEKIGEQAKHILRAGVKKPANLEVKRRIETLLEKLERPFEDPDQRRAYRALTLLERLGGDEARAMLEDLTRGAPAAWLTLEARESLGRIR